MNKLSALTLPSLWVILGACGSDPVQTPQEPREPTLLSFAPIAGAWGGTVTEIGPSGTATYRVDIVLGQSAPPGAKVGTIAYSESGRDCGGDLVATDVEGSAYTVEEDLTYGLDRCDNGEIHLVYDVGAGTLAFEWTWPPNPEAWDVTATLTRS
ncbi:MAG TPA: hypothetical protein VE173_09765 [Longimicrobiales bacterium]|nr:hypothetical protein [Longimicrobiales bacterium]